MSTLFPSHSHAELRCQPKQSKIWEITNFTFHDPKNCCSKQRSSDFKTKKILQISKTFSKNFLYWPKCQKDAFYVLLLYGYNSVCVLIGCWVGIIFLLWPGIMKFFSCQRLSWVVSKVMSMWAKTTIKKDGQSRTTLSITERKTSIYIYFFSMSDEESNSARKWMLKITSGVFLNSF